VSALLVKAWPWLAGGAAVLWLLASRWLRGRRAAQAEATAKREADRADRAELAGAATAEVLEDRAAGVEHHRRVETAAAAATEHPERAAAAERMRLRGRR
jgi:hypothetical protein